MIKVVVPAYNCMKWLPRCLDSLAAQEGAFDVVVIDDASEYEQRMFASRFCYEQGWKFIENTVNLKALHNIYRGIKELQCDPEDIIILLDGDDWLPHNQVLKRIQQEYDEKNCWLTYGSYVMSEKIEGPAPATEYPDWVVESGIYRVYSTNYNHIITFKAHLWNRLDEQDFKDDDGQWFQTGYDEAIMYPMLEIADGNFSFIDEPLYVYNTSNPLSAFSLSEEAERVSRCLQRRQPKRLYRIKSKNNHADIVFNVAARTDEAFIKYECTLNQRMLEEAQATLKNLGTHEMRRVGQGIRLYRR